MNEMRPVVLVVDDTPDNLTLISGLLKDMYKVKIATGGEKALTAAKADPPDIILLDVMMPVMDGYETCRQIKREETLKDIPVIFLTARNDVEDETRGFDLGAADYIIKPVSPSILLSRVRTHISLKYSRDFLKDKNHFLEMEVSRRMKEISLIQEVSIMAMAALAETRDSETGQHIQRTKFFVRELAEYLAGEDKYSGVFTPETIDLIVTSAPMHDIGKVGIPDHILLKPGPLTREEFEIMKTHTTLGRDAILSVEKLMNKPETFLKYAKEIVYSHHEKWDGSGYPEGLAGEDIPISARLMAVADVYDALVNKRVYKEAYPHETAVRTIIEDSGRHFDPDVVAAFLILQKRFREIAEAYTNI